MTATSHTLRPATAADAQLAYRIEEEAMRVYAEQTWGCWLPVEDPSRFIQAFEPSGEFIVEASGVPIGILAVAETPSEFSLNKLYLLAAHRSNGIGSALIAFVLSSRRDPTKPVRLRTGAVNTRAQAFYLRHGFVVEHTDNERVFFVSYAA